MIVGFIGDIHGKSVWKKFIENTDIEHWVFVGDYVDEEHLHPITDEEMLENLKEVLEFKANNPNKVSLLLGNHDLSYMLLNDRSKRVTRFRENISLELSDIFNFNRHLFQNSWQYGNVVATHAGIQHDWFINNFKGKLEYSISDQLNQPDNNSIFDIGMYRGGHNNCGGIFWCDRNELIKPLIGYTQVVGHNRVGGIKYYRHDKKYGDVYFVDCLNKRNEFLTLEIDDNEIHRI